MSGHYDPPMDVDQFGACINALVSDAGRIAGLPLDKMVEHIDYHLEHQDSDKFIDPQTKNYAVSFARIVAAAIHLKDTMEREVKS